jgi:hypothetical protein
MQLTGILSHALDQNIGQVSIIFTMRDSSSVKREAAATGDEYGSEGYRANQVP